MYSEYAREPQSPVDDALAQFERRQKCLSSKKLNCYFHDRVLLPITKFLTSDITTLLPSFLEDFKRVRLTLSDRYSYDSSTMHNGPS